MTTAKRRIPINNHQAGTERAPAARVDDLAASTTAEEAKVSGPFAPDGPVAVAEAAEAQIVAQEAVVRERDALADGLLRLRAEFENFRKRAARELVDARQRAQGELLGDLLPVLDNLERALDAAEHHDESKVLGGVRMTRDMFVDLLGRAGVEEIEGVGAHFDPQIHDAMMLQPSEQDEGVVTAVLERGYRQGERVLRPARVAVSSGPAAPGDIGTAG